MALPRPPRRCAPHAFFTEYLPQAWTALVGDAPLQGQSLDAELVAQVDEAFFTLRLTDGRLIVKAEAPKGTPLLHLRCTQDSYQTAVRELLPRVLDGVQARAGEVLAHAPKVLALWTPAQQTAFRELPGTITIAYTDDAGDVAQVELVQAGGAGPKAQVHLSDADLDALLKSRGNAAQSLLKARIRIEGDTGYVMRLVQLIP